MSTHPAEVPFNQIIQALQDESAPFPARYIHRFSDLEGKDLLALENIWTKVSNRRRQALMEDVQNMGEGDFLLDFTGLSMLALKDADALVRQLAVQRLAEYQSREFLSDFIRLAEKDPDASVRAAATGALGAYVYMGEVDELPTSALRRVEDCLLRIINGTEVPSVRRQALEALGYSSREEVPPLIDEAYRSGDLDWLTSALFAMGRSSNSVWAAKIQDKLDDIRPQVRAEAAAAAGELGLRTSVNALLGLLEDEDDDVRAAAIWSLSEIGGEGVRQALEEVLEYTEDEDEADLLEDALENLAFVEDLDVFSLIDLDEDGSGEEDSFEDEDLEEDD